MQERLLALSRRARRALEKELQASHQQRTSGSAALNSRGSATQPRGEQGMARGDRRAGQGEPSHARQKELSDRALRILEDLSSLGRQVPFHTPPPLRIPTHAPKLGPYGVCLP